MVVIFLGPPGSGKGAQGARLIDELGWTRIATGDLLRAARRDGTELGKEAARYMDAGELVPDGIVIEMVRERLDELDTDAGVFFDGYPRTVAQAVALDSMLPEAGRAVNCVLVLEISDDLVIRRISGRRSSPEGRVYNIHFDPPVVEGVCDVTGSELIQREDDREETVRRRLEIHHRQATSLLSYYDAMPIPVVRIPGEGSVDEVGSRIAGALERELGVEWSGR